MIHIHCSAGQNFVINIIQHQVVFAHGNEFTLGTPEARAAIAGEVLNLTRMGWMKPEMTTIHERIIPDAASHIVGGRQHQRIRVNRW